LDLIIFGTGIHISSPVGTNDPNEAENLDDLPPLPTSQATVNLQLNKSIVKQCLWI
jgi:hypothetical protein